MFLFKKSLKDEDILHGIRASGTTRRLFENKFYEKYHYLIKQAAFKHKISEDDAQSAYSDAILTVIEPHATKVQFLRSAPTARAIQLFTHAEAGPTETAEPTIYFQDAPLRLSELNQTEGFDAQLLVLSACKTGVGQNQRGEGVFSLARGFAALGIGSTVTTLWNVEDQPTYELTKLFYRYLEDGLPKDEALQSAKLEWIEKGGKADALPSQWAGMILVGDVQPLARNCYPLILGGVAVLLIVGGGVWWRRKRRSISR